MRGLLAILVGLAQVAGPWLCCCGPARAVAVTTAPARVEVCPLCAKQSPPVPAEPTGPARCPCGGRVAEPAPPAKPDPAADFSPELASAPESVAGRAVGVAPPVRGVCDLPFLPPGTRQFVHHVLRC